MKLDRVGNAKRNIFYNFITRIVTLFFPFFMRFVLLKEIGAEFLGLNSLFISILQVLNLAELGFTNAVVFSMYKPIANDDTQTLCAILRFLKSVYKKISIIIFALGLAILPFVPHLIKGEPPQNINIYFLYFIFLVNTCLTYAFFSYKQTILTAYQRIDIFYNINTIVFLFIYLLQLFIIYTTSNVYLYVFTNIISTILINCITAFFVNKKFPHIVCKGNLNKEIKEDIKEKVSGIMIVKVAGISRNAMDSIFLSAFLGLVETAIYNNYYYIMASIVTLMSIIYDGSVAGVGNSVASESVEKNYEDLQFFNFIYMWLSGWFAICLLCLFQPFTALFFGKNMLFPFSTVIAFCIYFYILKMGDMLSLYKDANGLFWQTRYIAIAEIILNILLNYIFGKYFGALGIVSATTISLLLTTNTFGASIVFKNYFKKQRLSEYFSKHLIYLFVTICIGIITFFICNLISSYSFIAFFQKALICVILPNILFLLIYFKTPQFKKAILFFKNIMLNKKVKNESSLR